MMYYTDNLFPKNPDDLFFISEFREDGGRKIQNRQILFERIKGENNKNGFDHSLSKKNSSFFERIPAKPASVGPDFQISDGTVSVGSKYFKDFPPDQQTQNALEEIIRTLRPWRKGPFEIAGRFIDSEWKSYVKWEALKKHLPDLKDKIILDIGSNNGYYLYRMSEYNPGFVLGIDPVMRVKHQFDFLNRFSRLPSAAVLPLGYSDVKYMKNSFDVIFLMGMVYHTTDPVAMLRLCLNALKKKGILIVETQGIPGKLPLALSPSKKYAGAGGHWFIPTASCLVNWLKRSGFGKSQVFHTHKLTTSEQRKTEDAPVNSFAEGLCQGHDGKTKEGYPAPIRIFAKACK